MGSGQLSYYFLQLAGSKFSILESLVLSCRETND